MKVEVQVVVEAWQPRLIAKCLRAIDTSRHDAKGHLRPIRLLLPVLLLLGASPAAAQWASLGDMPAPRRIENGLVYRSAQGVVSVTAAAPDIVRVRFSPARDFGARPLLRHREPRARRARRRRARRRPMSQIVTPMLTRVDPASALPCVDRRRRGQRAGRRRSWTWHREFRARRCGSGSAFETTSRSMASARRPAD